MLFRSVANAIVWPKIFERVRPAVLGARFVTIAGRMQKEAEVIHVVAEEIDDLTVLLARLAQGGGMPEIAADLDVTARGSAHAPTRRTV